MKHISPSSMQMYANCPLMWYYKYVAGLEQMQTPALLIGSSYHRCLELHHSNQQESIKTEMKEKLLSKYPEKEELKTLGIVLSLYRKYAENEIKGNIQDLEYNFKLSVDWLDIPLYGFIDRVDEDKIIEYKTSSFDYPETGTIQSKIYCYVIWKLKGKLLPVYFSVINKNKAHRSTYKIQYIKIEYTEKDMLDLEEEIKDFYLKVKNKEFEPHKGDHCYWCPYGRSGTNNCKYA